MSKASFESGFESDFESGLRSSLRGLSQAAPSGPTQASVIDALHARTRHQQQTARLATLAAALVVLAVGLSWLVLANMDRPDAGVGPSQVSSLHEAKQDEESEKGGQSKRLVNGQAPSAAVFNTTALLGHMNDIPFERNLILRVAGLDETATISAFPNTSPDASPDSGPDSSRSVSMANGWNPKLDLDRVDFAYLPEQGDCIFCVTLPSLSGRVPF